MNTTNEQLEWIVRFAICADAAIAAEIGFVSASKTEELSLADLDEMEMSSLCLTTQTKSDNNRTFAFDRNIEDVVEKVFGFDFSNARDCGTSGDNIRAEFSLSKTKQLGPNICSKLLSLIEITCKLEMHVDMLDGHDIELAIIGAVKSVEFRAIDEGTSEAEIQTAINSTIQQLQALAELCEKSGNYVPFDDLILQ